MQYIKSNKTKQIIYIVVEGTWNVPGSEAHRMLHEDSEADLASLEAVGLVSSSDSKSSNDMGLSLNAPLYNSKNPSLNTECFLRSSIKAKESL